MKRFKKLTIYILVGVLLSSSVMLSYRKADEVKAAAGAITLSAAALVAIGLLGAYGIVYKGAVDSTTGNYVWQSQPDSYPQELENALPYLAQLYNTLVYQAAQNGGYDPNDDWDGDEDKPPIWDKLVKFMNENQTKALALGGTVLSSIVAAIGYAFYQESQKPKEGNLFFGSGEILGAWTYEYEYQETTYQRNEWYKVRFSNGGAVKSVIVRFPYSNGIYTSLVVYSKEPFHYQAASKTYPEYSGVVTNMKPSGDYYVYWNGATWNYDIVESSSPVIYTNYDITNWYNMDAFLDELEADDSMIWTEDFDNLNQESMGISSDIKIDDDNESLEPIFPLIQIPSSEAVGDFLGGLSTNVGNESGTQAVVDQFINSLQQTQPNPNPEGGVVPDPSPDPNPDPNPNPNPDIGGEEGEEDSEKDKSNLLADLKDVFPFCIPFDLIDCFRLFNAEPETPRVEIPLHFGIIDKDYTFVIDLKDFDGVAQVCRTMFLILFMTGLVLSTRSLIRG